MTVHSVVFVGQRHLAELGGYVGCGRRCHARFYVDVRALPEDPLRRPRPGVARVGPHEDVGQPHLLARSRPDRGRLGARYLTWCYGPAGELAGAGPRLAYRPSWRAAVAAVPVATAAARVAVLMGALLVLMRFGLVAAAAVTVMMTCGRVLMGVAVTVAWFVAVHHWAPSPSSLGR